MKKTKNIMFAAALCIWAYLQVKISAGGDIINIYNGVGFNGRIVLYVRSFFLFSCYCLYAYNEFETYISRYGVLLITREKSRNKLLMRLTGKLIRLTATVEAVKIFCFVVFALIIRGSITVNNPLEFILMAVLNILSYLIILFIQMSIEIFLSGNVAVCVSMAYFLTSLCVSDYIYKISFLSKRINLLFVPNITMKLRLDEMKVTGSIYYIIAGTLMFCFSCMYILVYRIFRKRDLL